MTLILFKFKLQQFILCLEYIQTCLDLCDPEGISSRCGVWRISCQVVYFTCFTYLDTSYELFFVICIYCIVLSAFVRW